MGKVADQHFLAGLLADYEPNLTHTPEPMICEDQSSQSTLIIRLDHS